jgi:hypothetical protein
VAQSGCFQYQHARILLLSPAPYLLQVSSIEVIRTDIVAKPYGNRYIQVAVVLIIGGFQAVNLARGDTNTIIEQMANCMFHNCGFA